MKMLYKITGWLVLLTFGFEAGGGNVWSQIPHTSQTIVHSQKKTLAEEWEEAIEELQEETEYERISHIMKKIQRIDERLKKEFKETERFLKKKKLSSKIIEKHYDFVKQYNENYALLKENIDLSIKTKSTKRLKEFIKKAQYRPKIRPIDPNKLPHRPLPKREPIPPRIQKTKTKGLKITSESPNSYLSETIDVEITDEIRRLAIETLKSNPLLIYEYVRNNFDYEPYYGSLKGSQQTLWEKGGNDFDLSSLLISLYRASNIPARYVYGTIEIPIEKAMNWIGVQDPYTCASIFASAGIPSRAITQGGNIVAIQLEHCWVEAWIDYIPSRGAIHIKGDTWIPLDPSFKEYSYMEKINLTVPFDEEAFINEIKASATINEEEGYINIDYALIQQKMDEYRTQVENYLKSHPDITVDNLLGKKIIKKQKFEILFTGLPYKTILSSNKYSEIPDSLRHKIQFNISEESHEGGQGISYIASIPELSGKRITLSYIPATSEDEVIINSYLPKPHQDGSPIQPNEFPTNLPAYLINLKPELKIEGIIKVRGSQIRMGQDQTFTMNFIEPERGIVDSVSNNIIAGEFCAIGLDIGNIPRILLEKRKAKLESIKNTMEANPEGTYRKDDFLGEMLYIAVIGYFYELDIINKVQAKKFNVVTTRFPSEAIVSINLNVSYLFELPNRANSSGISIDIDRDVYVVLPRDGNNVRIKNFMVNTGITGSALEHGILEQFFSSPENPVEGISAVKALAIANNQGIPIYQIDKENIQILPNLQVSLTVKDEIQNAINAGKVVTISKTNINYEGWRGVGYIVMDPETGEAAYLISGGAAGAIVITEIFFTLLALLVITSIISINAPLIGAIAIMLSPIYMGFIIWLELILDEWIRETVEEIVLIGIDMTGKVAAFVLHFPLLATVCYVLFGYHMLEWLVDLWFEHKEDKRSKSPFINLNQYCLRGMLC